MTDGELFGGVQAYLAVPAKFVDAILDDGYKIPETSGRYHRDGEPWKRIQGVPLTFVDKDDIDAVKAMRKHHSDVKETVVLEVFGVTDLSLFDRQNSKYLANHLPSEHLRKGAALPTRGYEADTVCPFCGETLSAEAIEERKKMVGVRVFVENAFMSCPCPKESCIEQMKERQERLEKGERVELFHLTDRASADLIKASSKMIRGSKGNAGGGIYFATSIEDAYAKALHKGAMLKCRVALGDVHVEDECLKWDFKQLMAMKKDSIHGKHNYATRAYVVYSWDQVDVIGECDDNGVIVA